MMVDDGRYYEVLVDMVDMVDGRYSTYGTAVWSIWLGGGGGCVGSGSQSETSVRLFRSRRHNRPEPTRSSTNQRI